MCVCVFSTGVACERSCRPFSFCLKVGPALSPLDPLWGKGGRSGVDLADVEGLGRSEDPSGLGAAGLLCETEAGRIPRVGWAGREKGGEEKEREEKEVRRKAPPLQRLRAGGAWAPAVSAWAGRRALGVPPWRHGGWEKEAVGKRRIGGGLEPPDDKGFALGGLDVEGWKTIWWSGFGVGPELHGERRLAGVWVLWWSKEATRTSPTLFEWLGKLSWWPSSGGSPGGVGPILWVVCTAEVEGWKVPLPPVRWWVQQVQVQVGSWGPSWSCSHSKMAFGESVGHDGEWVHAEAGVGIGQEIGGGFRPCCQGSRTDWAPPPWGSWWARGGRTCWCDWFGQGRKGSRLGGGYKGRTEASREEEERWWPGGPSWTCGATIATKGRGAAWRWKRKGGGKERPKASLKKQKPPEEEEEEEQRDEPK